MTPEISNARVFQNKENVPGASFTVAAYTYGEGRIIDSRRYFESNPRIFAKGNFVRYLPGHYPTVLTAYDLYGPMGEDPRVVAASENFKGDKPFDFVTGHVAFQFIHPKDRQAQMARMKQNLREGGLLIVSEKHLMEADQMTEYWARECWKGDYKAINFSDEQNRQKEKEVLRNPDSNAKEDKMEDRQATRQEFKEAATRNFGVDGCIKIWNSGNFTAYALSEDPELLHKFCSNLPDMTNAHTAETIYSSTCLNLAENASVRVH